jgi:hypothetical protein
MSKHANDFVLAIFEREIWGKIMLINAENIKKKEYKQLSISNLDKYYPDLDLKTF